jgi:hypothetical protein
MYARRQCICACVYQIILRNNGLENNRRVIHLDVSNKNKVNECSLGSPSNLPWEFHFVVVRIISSFFDFLKGLGSESCAHRAAKE